jgi:CheY-specific phosphatase CheX
MSPLPSAHQLSEVTKNVLSEAAFLFCDDVAQGTAPLEARLVEATITFEATTPGRITLRLPWSLACEAAANLLGTEPGDEEVEANAHAAVGELLNMISGSALERWFGSASPWALGLPMVSEHEGQLPSRAPKGEVVALVIDSARFEIEASFGSAA